jgi:hypothetical protein
MAFLTRLKKQLMISVLYNRKKQLVNGIFKKQLTLSQKIFFERWRPYTAARRQKLLVYLSVPIRYICKKRA